MIRHVVRAIPGELLALSALTGVAFWVTFGSFDLLFLGNSAVRAAMLPPWWTLAAAIVLAFGALTAIVRAASIAGARRLAAMHTAARHITELDPRAVRHVILPSAALGLLALTYFPWLPDRLPILWVVAGPGRWLVWIVVAWLVARGIWLLGGSAPLWLTRQQRRGALMICLVTALVCGSTAYAFKRTPLFPGGDEPHYLIIAQSLWRDHDLKIENNHKRGDFREYFDRERGLKPDYLTRGVDHEIYSIHPVGMPVLIAPVYALGGYDLVVWAFVAMASAAAALLWLVARRATDDAGAAAAAWAACCLNGVWVFNSFAIYPEVPGALAAIAAFAFVQRPLGASRGGWRRWLGAGVALATLPWLSTKYAPMSATLILVALGRLWLPSQSAQPPQAHPQHPPQPRSSRPSTHPPRPRSSLQPPEPQPMQPQPARVAVGIASIALLVPYAISLAGWFTFFYVIWGTPWPSAPYGTQHETGLRFLLAGAPGLLFDQEYGLLAFAPALIVSVVGLVAMWRDGGTARRLAIEIAVPCATLLATVGAFHIWWGGTAAPGRPMISGLLLLGVPFAWRYHQQREKPAILAAYHLLMAIGLAFGLSLAFAQNGLMLDASRNGVSRLMEWLSPDWSLWRLAPTFVAQTPILATLMAVAWLLAASLAGWWLHSRPRTWTPGRAMLSAALTCAVSLSGLSIVLPWTLGRWTGAPAVVPPGARSRLLDEFDASRRPIALLFDPIHRVDPHSLPPMVEFVARADDRRPKQPVSLLYNARFALPAGRYAVEIVSSAETVPHELKGTLALQLGRIGPPVRQWDIDLVLPGIWGRSFDLPIDVGFVGFHGSPEIEQAAPSIRIRPVSIVDVHARLPDQEVLAASALPGATLFFHDELVVPEGPGFWSPGHARLTVTIAAPHPHPQRVHMRAGPLLTRLRLAVGGWRQDVELEPFAQRDIDLPMSPAGVTRLVIDTRTAFVPARFDPASDDERALGCWIELN